MTEQDDIGRIRRREARSGRVSYGDPVVLYESSRRRVVMVPFYVPRSSGRNDLAVKLVSYAKGDQEMDWIFHEEKSLSLNEEAGRRLLNALRQHLAVAREGDDGDYIAIRLSEGVASFGDTDPVAVARALTGVLATPEIASHLASTELTCELTSALHGAVRLNELRSAVAALGQHLSAGMGDEQTYQKWCEQHCWAFGNAYVIRDDVRSISTGDTLDLLLPNVLSGYRDIVELKRPDKPVLFPDSSHRNYYFSADVSKAIGQCHRYLDVLHEEAAKGLRDYPEIVAYHPRAKIVIGRSHDWEPEQNRALHGLNSRLHGITIITYDHLLAQGERLLALLTVDVGTDELGGLATSHVEDDLGF